MLLKPRYSYHRPNEDDPCRILVGDRHLLVGGCFVEDEETAKDIVFLLNEARRARLAVEGSKHK